MRQARRGGGLLLGTSCALQAGNWLFGNAVKECTLRSGGASHMKHS
jgi:hypothetical protein